MAAMVAAIVEGVSERRFALCLMPTDDDRTSCSMGKRKLFCVTSPSSIRVDELQLISRSTGGFLNRSLHLGRRGRTFSGGRGVASTI